MMNSNEPLLHRAARLGDHGTIRSLVERGEDLNALYHASAADHALTPLMVAAGSSDGATVETVALLLQLGADPVLAFDGLSAAAFALSGFGPSFPSGGDAARLALLLEAGSPLPADPEWLNKALCDSARVGDSERLRILLGLGLDPNGYWNAELAAEREQMLKNATALYTQDEIIALQSMPEEIKQLFEDALEKVHEAKLSYRALAPYPDEIPLLCAAASNSPECVQMLLDAGASVTIRDDMGQTAMYSAAGLEVIQLLLQAGLPIEDTNRMGRSPLIVAVSEKEEALSRVQALIEAGADVNATVHRSYTVFMCAVGSNPSSAILRLLVEKGADPHAVTEFGFNAFHAAIDVNGEANSEESVRDRFGYLHEIGVDIEHRNYLGHTPLARAIVFGNSIEVTVLCDLGADPNANCTLHTCDSEACEEEELPLIFHVFLGGGLDSQAKLEALLRAGADPLASDHEGFTALEHAIGELCSDSIDFQKAFDAFYNEYERFWRKSQLKLHVREKFVAKAIGPLRTFVEGFAGRMPLPDISEIQVQRREDLIACIATLCAYQVWTNSAPQWLKRINRRRQRASR